MYHLLQISRFRTMMYHLYNAFLQSTVLTSSQYSMVHGTTPVERMNHDSLHDTSSDPHWQPSDERPKGVSNNLTTSFRSKVRRIVSAHFTRSRDSARRISLDSFLRTPVRTYPAIKDTPTGYHTSRGRESLTGSLILVVY